MIAKPQIIKQMEAGLMACKAIADAIKGLGRVPAGHLYATVMPELTLTQFQQIIGILKGAGLVEEKNHELIWIAKEAA